MQSGKYMLKSECWRRGFSAFGKHYASKLTSSSWSEMMRLHIFGRFARNWDVKTQRKRNSVNWKKEYMDNGHIEIKLHSWVNAFLLLHFDTFQKPSAAGCHRPLFIKFLQRTFAYSVQFCWAFCDFFFKKTTIPFLCMPLCEYVCFAATVSFAFVRVFFSSFSSSFNLCFFDDIKMYEMRIVSTAFVSSWFMYSTVFILHSLTHIALCNVLWPRYMLHVTHICVFVVVVVAGWLFVFSIHVIIS